MGAKPWTELYFFLVAGNQHSGGAVFWRDLPSAFYGLSGYLVGNGPVFRIVVPLDGHEKCITHTQTESDRDAAEQSERYRRAPSS